MRGAQDRPRLAGGWASRTSDQLDQRLVLASDVRAAAEDCQVQQHVLRDPRREHTGTCESGVLYLLYEWRL